MLKGKITLVYAMQDLGAVRAGGWHVDALLHMAYTPLVAMAAYLYVKAKFFYQELGFTKLLKQIKVKLKIVLILNATLLFSCRNIEKNGSVVIEIRMPTMQAQKLKGKYLYLYDLKTRIISDSALVESENTFLRIKLDTSFIPHLVGVKYIDTNNHFIYKRFIGFRNPYIAKTINNFFYLDRGVTVIGSYYDEKNYINIFEGSKQNFPFLKDISLRYIEKESKDFTAIINDNIKLIIQYPFSYHLLNQLYYYKEKFPNDDLKRMLSNFDEAVKKSELFKSFSDYFSESAQYDKLYPTNIKLADSSNLYYNIINPGARYNLIVFWASWCGPCRDEIAMLKKMDSVYKTKGLNICSISIDSNIDDWKSALKFEKMPWKQFIAIDSTKKVLDVYYNIKQIPRAYLFDRNKNLIAIFSGSKSELESKLNGLLW